jgi:hypothetical protein
MANDRTTRPRRPPTRDWVEVTARHMMAMAQARGTGTTPTPRFNFSAFRTDADGVRQHPYTTTTVQPPIPIPTSECFALTERLFGVVKSPWALLELAQSLVPDQRPVLAWSFFRLLASVPHEWDAWELYDVGRLVLGFGNARPVLKAVRSGLDLDREDVLAFDIAVHLDAHRAPRSRHR